MIKVYVIYIKRKLRTCRIQIQIEKNMIYCKKIDVRTVKKFFCNFSNFVKENSSKVANQVWVYNLYTEFLTETYCISLEAYFCTKQLFVSYQSSMNFILAIRVKSMCINFFQSANSSKLTKTYYVWKFEFQSPLCQQKWTIKLIVNL